MSYGGSPSDAGGPRPRSSGIGCMLLLVVGIVFFYITTQNARRAALEQQGERPGRTLPPARVEPMDPIRPGPGGMTRPQPGERPLEKQPPQSTTEGDWSIEEVEVQPSTESDEGAVLVIPPPQTTPAAPPTPPKRTEEGDWSIEEVETEQSQDGPAVEKEAPKKTEQGDWEIEEVEIEPEKVPSLP